MIARSPSSSRPAFALLLFTVLAAACTKGEPSVSSPPDTTVTPPPDTTVTPPPPPPPPASVILTVAGNIADCHSNNDDLTAALVDTTPGVVFTAGDNAFPDGSAATYQNCYQPSWGRVKARTWAVLGNHDYDSGNANAAFDYFGDRAGPRGLGYYSTDVGDWHIIVLNDNGSYVPFNAGSTQEAWLRADLAANTKRCTIALWHQPLFLSSTTPGFTARSMSKVLWNDLYAANADVVVNGHQHHYERMAPMDPSGARNDSTGIRQFNVGVGGESSLMPTEIHPNSQVIGIDFGVLRLTLRATDYDWQFIPVGAGTFTDSGTGTCH